MSRMILAGGSDKVGRHIVQYFVHRLRTHLTSVSDGGQVFNAMSSYTCLHKVDRDLRSDKIDAVMRLAAILSIMITPDSEAPLAVDISVSEVGDVNNVTTTNSIPLLMH